MVHRAIHNALQEGVRLETGQTVTVIDEPSMNTLRRSLMPEQEGDPADGLLNAAAFYGIRPPQFPTATPDVGTAWTAEAGLIPDVGQADYEVIAIEGDELHVRVEARADGGSGDGHDVDLVGLMRVSRDTGWPLVSRFYVRDAGPFSDGRDSEHHMVAVYHDEERVDDPVDPELLLGIAASFTPIPWDGHGHRGMVNDVVVADDMDVIRDDVASADDALSWMRDDGDGSPWGIVGSTDAMRAMSNPASTRLRMFEIDAARAVNADGVTLARLNVPTDATGDLFTRDGAFQRASRDGTPSPWQAFSAASDGAEWKAEAAAIEFDGSFLGFDAESAVFEWGEAGETGSVGAVDVEVRAFSADRVDVRWRSSEGDSHVFFFVEALDASAEPIDRKVERRGPAELIVPLVRGDLDDDVYERSPWNRDPHERKRELRAVVPTAYTGMDATMEQSVQVKDPDGRIDRIRMHLYVVPKVTGTFTAAE